MPPALMTRLVAGDDWRRTRLHDMRGNFIGPRALLTDAPRVTVQAAARRFLHRYPALPWIPYPAIRALSRLARPEWSVLEHGAGMSTVWWAQRVAKVHSIEANAVWCQRVRRELRRRGLTNVQLEHRPDDETYCDLSGTEGATFDMVVIDGHAREKIAPQVPRLLKQSAYVYFDNSDFAAQWHEMYGEAESLLLEWARLVGARTTYFTGLPPATTTATQGLLITLVNRAPR